MPRRRPGGGFCPRDVQTVREVRVGLHRGFRAQLRQLHHEGQGGVVEREGRGAGDRAGHVRHAIMDHAVHLEHRVLVRGGMRRLEAAALVDRDVDQHRTALHRLEHFACDQLRRRCAGTQHRADDEVGVLHRRGDRRLGGIGGLDLAAEEHVELGKPRVRDVIDRHIRAHADRHLRCVDARNAAAEDRDSRRRHAGHAAEQYAAAALFLLQIMGADLDRHAAGHFGHRLEQGEGTVVRRHRFIGDAGRAGFHQSFGLRLVRGEVEVSEE